MKRMMWKAWVLKPAWHAMLAWALTIIVVTLLVWVRQPSEIVSFLAFILLICVGIFGIVTIMVAVVTYPTIEKFLTRLLLLYISLMFVYANFYFWMTVFFDPQPAFAGIHSPWEWLGRLEERRMTLANAALSVVDCLHFSCVTITTLGFGDMHPLHWSAKLLTDSEVLAGTGMGVIIVGLGRFFSPIGNKA